MEDNVKSILYFSKNEDSKRKKLFNFALSCAKSGKVLYISKEELNELPDLFQEQNINGQLMKMISFVYALNLGSLIECLSTLPDWQNVPVAIVVDDLTQYCDKQTIQEACGITSLLIDAAKSCAKATHTPSILCVSITANIGEDYCTLLKELYFNCYLE